MSGRGKSAASMALIEAAQEILAEIAPCSVRAVAYQLFNRKLIPDMSKGSTNRVSDQLVWGRENGYIDWADIVDETRTPECNAGWDNASQRIKDAVDYYRRDNWQDQPKRVLVIAEKSTVAGTIRPVLEEYGVDLLSMHGFSSATALNTLADQIDDNAKPTVLLYIGDFDPSGMHMSEVDIPKRLERYGAGWYRFERVALIEDDLDDLGDACFSAHDKTADKRCPWFIKNHGTTCAELDALSPAVLRERLQEAIESHMDMDAWERSLEIERAEVESMKKFHDAWAQSLGK